MKYYAYYPGCSLEATALPIALSTEAITKALDMELIELDNWTCCGSTPYGGIDEIEAIAVATRNLALAEKTGLDLVAPCSSCYLTLKKAQTTFRENAKVRGKIAEALAAANLKYEGNGRVRHLVEVLFNDIGTEAIAAKVKKKLTGLKVACYYGCQQTRPKYGFDDAESPQWLDLLTLSLGAEAVPYPLKARCCGGALVISQEDVALELIYKLLANAADNGAQCVVTTTCPLCFTNLDAYQSRVKSRFKANFNLPVLAITQLIGVALELKPKALGLNKNIVSPGKLLSPYL